MAKSPPQSCEFLALIKNKGTRTNAIKIVKEIFLLPYLLSITILLLHAKI